MSCSPLCEKMGELHITDTTAFTKGKPAFQFFEIEGIGTVRKRYIYQLHRCAFSSRSRIQRRGEKRRQKHVDTIFCSFLHVFFHKRPVFFTENRSFVPVSNTVGMEPFRMKQRLLRKTGIQTFHSKGTATENSSIITGKGDSKIIASCRKRTFCRNRKPQATPLSGYQRERLLYRIERIRIQSGRGTQ